MTSPFIRYGRPLAENTPLAPLQIVGSMPDYEVGDSFEGRLDIVNGVGKSRAEIVEASLPPGAYVYVDNITQEVVLKWPTYSPVPPSSSSVPNGDFELGNDGSWKLGQGWTVDTYVGPDGNEVYDGTHSAGFRSFKGESTIYSAPAPCPVNTPISLSVKFRQGASSSGSLRGAAVLAWCDANGKVLNETRGNEIKDGRGDGYVDATVIGNAPAGTETVRAAFWCHRKKENKPARVDHFTWDHRFSLGSNKSIDFTVTIKVTDAANRVAYWSGGLWFQSAWLRSQRYPVIPDTDALSVVPFFVSASSAEGLLRHVQPPEDFLSVEPYFIGAETRGTQWAYTMDAEDISIDPFFVSASTLDPLRSYTVEAENMIVSPFFASASTLVVLRTNTVPAENLTVTPYFVGASTS